MKEAQFQAELVKDIKKILPDSVVIKNDANYQQGFPDLLILANGHWAALECKASANAARQPNQDHWVERLDGMSYAAFIYPENKKEILDAIQQALGA